jgi:hypothetical protein
VATLKAIAAGGIILPLLKSPVFGYLIIHTSAENILLRASCAVSPNK